MTETNEPFDIPDYAHNANDTLTIVPNGDSDDYSRLLSDLQRERMLRVEAQTERDKLAAAGQSLAEIISRWSKEGETLKDRVALLEAANAELLRGLQQYGDYRNWVGKSAESRFCRVFTFGFNNVESGWAFGLYTMRRAELLMEGQTLPPHEYFDATTATE